MPLRRDGDPAFSVIVVDYEPSVTRELFRRKMACLAEQACKDFEVLVYHDGPKSQSYEADLADAPFHPDTRFFVTGARDNDWGHSNRDRGIRAARGEWIVHTNADNLFYPTFIERLRDEARSTEPSLAIKVPRPPAIIKGVAKRLDRAFNTTFRAPKLIETVKWDVLIYAILMRGLVPASTSYKRVQSRAMDHALVFGGVPVVFGNIDLMQFVMRRSLWLKEGGWVDKSESSDGRMYPQFARKYCMKVIPEVLGEHW